MEDELSERRLVENELLFRNANEQVRKSLDDLKDSSEAQHVSGLQNTDRTLHFYCECSDKNCRERITMKPSEHKKLHKNASQFVLLPGHQVNKVERVINNQPDYIVVEKFVTPPK